jgi:ABC-type lipoprotein release transport system permease subunit
MNLGQRIPLLLRLALRNLRLYKLRTFIIGGLLGFGTILAIVGLSLLRDVEFSMRESITGSVVGDIQVYSNQGKDELAIFGGDFMGRPDIGTLPDIAPLRDATMTVDNVKAFIPMGIDMVFLARGNELDDALDALREALRGGDQEIITDRIDQLRFHLAQLKKELAEQRKLARDDTEIDAAAEAIALAEAPGYLDTLNTLDEEKLQFLETKIAPISGEKTPVYLNYVGTDVTLFREQFPKFKMVEGEVLPPGRRGILISRKFSEDFLKNLVARLMDRLNKRVVRSGMKIEGDAENMRIAHDLPKQYSQIMAHLDRDEAQRLAKELQEFGIEGDDGKDLIERLTVQLQKFFAISDDNFKVRYKWFYDHIAPLIKMYEISPGETITLRSYTRSGYIKSLPLKVYGVYTFEGLEDSDLAGAMNVIDLVSFRELYGLMDESSKKELEAMRAEIGLKDVSADNAEEALFGESAGPLEKVKEVSPAVHETIEFKPSLPEAFDEKEIQHGLALNASIRLKDPDLVPETIEQLKNVFEERGLDLRVIDWQEAAGIAGQFVVIVRMALLFSLGVIFLVALVIINNSIVVGTLDRTKEIGTMRAIGAQKSFVVELFLAETLMTGLIGAVLAAVIAAAILTMFGNQGIPAANDIVTFLFSGPRLYPEVRWAYVVALPVAVTIVATIASLYAARHAAQILPAEAMQEKE